MTVKQLRLIKHLGDKDCPTVADASKRAGYSYGARNMYRVNTKRHIQKSIGSDPQAIIEAYEDLRKRCQNKGDLSNEKGVLDSLSRINSMFTDKSIVTKKDDVEPTISDGELDKELAIIIEKRKASKASIVDL